MAAFLGDHMHASFDSLAIPGSKYVVVGSSYVDRTKNANGRSGRMANYFGKL